MMSVGQDRAAMALAPVATPIWPAVVTSAGRVVSRLSRTDAFHCAAVSAVLETAVRGTDQAIKAPLRALGRGTVPARSGGGSGRSPRRPRREWAACRAQARTR